MSELPLDADFAEKHSDDIYRPSVDRFSTGWGTLIIDMSLMTEEDRGKVYEAQRLLSEVGISFDTGSGAGGRDWELDWSLSGAYLKIRPLKCMKCQKEGKPEIWVIYRIREGRVVRYPYCSTKCTDEDMTRAPSWEVLARVSSDLPD